MKKTFLIITFLASAIVLSFGIARWLTQGPQDSEGQSFGQTVRNLLNIKTEGKKLEKNTGTTFDEVVIKNIVVNEKALKATLPLHGNNGHLMLDTLENSKEGFLISVQEVVIGGLEKEEIYVGLGDVIIPTPPGRRYVKGRRPPMGRPDLWPEGRIPYMVDANLKVKSQLYEVLKNLNEQTGIRFVPKRDEKDYVVIRAHEKYCLSNVGKIGGEQTIWLAPNCEKGAILHEVLHTLGLFHEQSRPDRDDYIMIFWENIKVDFWEQFKKIPSEYHHQGPDREFDFHSIMLYPPGAFAINPEFATIAKVNGDLYEPETDRLSQGDIDKLQAMYNLSGPSDENH